MSLHSDQGRQRAVTVSPHADGLLAFASRHAPGFVMSRTQHDWHKILVVRSGSIAVIADDRHAVGSGSLIIIPAGVAHALHDLETAQLYGIGLTSPAIHSLPALAAAWQSLAPTADCRLIGADLGGNGEARLAAAQHILSALASGNRLAAWASVLALLSDLPSAGVRTGGGMEETFAWLGANPLAPMRVEDLAARAGVSVRTFTSQFKQRFEVNFSTWRRQNRWLPWLIYSERGLLHSTLPLPLALVTYPMPIANLNENSGSTRCLGSPARCPRTGSKIYGLLFASPSASGRSYSRQIYFLTHLCLLDDFR